MEEELGAWPVVAGEGQELVVGVVEVGRQRATSSKALSASISAFLPPLPSSCELVRPRALQGASKMRFPSRLAFSREHAHAREGEIGGEEMR